MKVMEKHQSRILTVFLGILAMAMLVAVTAVNTFASTAITTSAWFGDDEKSATVADAERIAGLTVDETASLTLNADLTVTGDLTIAADQTLTVKGTGSLIVNGDIICNGDLTIDSGATLSVAAGKTLTVASGSTVTNGGTVTNSGIVADKGTIVNNGSVSGKVLIVDNGSLEGANASAIDPYYELTLTNATLTSPAAQSYDGKSYIQKNTTLTLKASSADGNGTDVWFDGDGEKITDADTSATGLQFAMPGKAYTAIAQIKYNAPSALTVAKFTMTSAADQKAGKLTIAADSGLTASTDYQYKVGNGNYTAFTTDASGKATLNNVTGNVTIRRSGKTENGVQTYVASEPSSTVIPVYTITFNTYYKENSDWLIKEINKSYVTENDTVVKPADIKTTDNNWYGSYANLQAGTPAYTFTIVAADTTLYGRTGKTASNKWTKALTIENWTEGDTAKTPSATAQYGTVTYKYYDSDKKELSAAPTKTGKYFVKAFVAKGTTYEALESDYVSFEILADTSSFTDVSTGDYFHKAVEWAKAKGITAGVTTGNNPKFGPKQNVTRAEIITWLYVYAGSPEVSTTASFNDVKSDAYYSKAVAWAAANGITAGTPGNNFEPDAVVKRAEAVTFLARYKKILTSSGSNPFTDVASDSYYAEAVKWAYTNGITAGRTSTTFVPGAGCTRAEAIMFLYKTDAVSVAK